MVVLYILIIVGLIGSKAVPTHIIEAEDFNVEKNLPFEISRGYEEYALKCIAYDGLRMDIEIKFPKIPNIKFNLTVYEFNHFPSDDDIINLNYVNEPALISTVIEEDNNYFYNYFYKVTSEKLSFYAIYILASTDEEKVQFDLKYNMKTNKYRHSDVIDLSCNIQNSFDTSVFPDRTIPEFYEMYFRVPVLPSKNVIVNLTTDIISNSDFVFNFCENSTKPDDKTVKKRRCQQKDNEEKISNVHKYTIETKNDTSYLSMVIVNELGDFKSLNIYIDNGEEKEKNLGKFNQIHPYIYLIFLLILI